MPGKGDLQMKEYEVVHEIFNECANNQMRDVFIEEVPIDDLEEYVRKHHEKSGTSPLNGKIWPMELSSIM